MIKVKTNRKLYIALFLLFLLPFSGCVQPQDVTLEDEPEMQARPDQYISSKKVQSMIGGKDSFVLIDTRPAEQYAKNHLPAAISIPACEMTNASPMLPEDKDRLLVFYCGWSGCIMNKTASDAAIRAGYTNIKILSDGLAGWVKTGYPTYAADTFIAGGEPLIIDLRPVQKANLQFIPGSVSVPLAVLESKLDDISKSADIVIYSDNGKESSMALSLFREAGYPRIAMVEGEFQGWRSRGNAIAEGRIKQLIRWSRKPGQGEVSLAEFTRALDNPNNTVILDVRTNEEVGSGKLKNSKHIPLDELAGRMKELPLDKKILVYCRIGARADMAAQVLKKNGYNALFLVADLNCSGNTCTVSD